MFLVDLAVNLSELVLRAAPKRWQRAVEADSALGVAIGFLLAFAGIAAFVAIVAYVRS